MLMIEAAKRKEGGSRTSLTTKATNTNTDNDKLPAQNIMSLISSHKYAI